jgi:nucleoid-associated protein YgaU
VWLYFINRHVGGEEAVIEQEVNPPAAEAKSSQQGAKNKVASSNTNAASSNTAPSNANATPSNEDEFASILKELAGTEESHKAGGGAPGATGKEKGGIAAAATAAPTATSAPAPAAISTPEQAPVPPKELTKELATLEEQTKKAEQAAKQLNKATGQLLKQEKETTALMSKAETKTRENLSSLNKEAAAEGGENENALAATPPPPPPVAEKAPVQAAFPKTVTVQPGDSLSTIAKRVYGDMNKWRLIYKANQDQLKDPNALLVGMKLTIPAPQE